MKNIFTVFLLATALLLSTTSHARVLAGLIDRNGNPIHSGDEFTLHVNATVTSDPYGFRYSYDLTNDVMSNQPIIDFTLLVQDIYSIVVGSSSSPWGESSYPVVGTTSRSLSAFFGTDGVNPPPLAPGQTLAGFTFLSPYPPGIIKAYAEGVTNIPWYDSAPSTLDEYDLITPYGPGKVFPVIGPVKPSTPNVTDNYSVIGCTGGICDVQLDITGPQDPYGTAYTYLWSGAFGSATGAKPVVQLSAGTYNVSVSVSDPYATLVTATMPVTVIDPNPPVITPPAGNNGGGNAGGGTNGNGQGTGDNANPNGDIDHDGTPDDEDDDRDGDGKPNNQDNDPDHPD